MTEWLDGIDVSVYQGSITQPQWQALYDAGERVAVVGAADPQPNGHAEGNLGRAQAAGFIIATYLALAPSVTGRGTVARAQLMCGRYWQDLAFVGVDCEVDGLTRVQILEACSAIAGSGQRAVIYTGRWWWVDHFGDPQVFADLPLWAADYRASPDPESIPLYGGWTRDKLIGHQWMGTASLAGVDVDRNVFRREFMEQEEHMPTPEYEELKGDIGALKMALAIEAERKTLRLVATNEPGGFYAIWITDGAMHSYVSKQATIVTLQNAGFWPAHVENLPEELRLALHLLPRGPDI